MKQETYRCWMVFHHLRKTHKISEPESNMWDGELWYQSGIRDLSYYFYWTNNKIHYNIENKSTSSNLLLYIFKIKYPGLIVNNTHYILKESEN